ncbi:MAG: hypothetical protein M3373_04850 [Gemmatimonadota bacterium]|nr:hypothetical protein [Gemmatimonadota bacterium]
MRSPDRHRLVAALALLLVAAPHGTSVAQPGFPPDNPDSWRVAGTAKVLCSALFVSGRDEAEARAHVAPYFLGAKLDSITAFEIDRQRKLVRLTLANRITREAKLYGDQGCVIHQPGRDTVFLTMPWPMGDVLPAAPLPAEIDTIKLREAVDAAFATPAGLTAAFVVVYKGRIVAERYATEGLTAGCADAGGGGGALVNAARISRPRAGVIEMKCFIMRMRCLRDCAVTLTGWRPYRKRPEPPAG